MSDGTNRSEHSYDEVKSVIVSEEGHNAPLERRIEAPDGALICFCNGTVQAVQRCMLDLIQIKTGLKDGKITHKYSSTSSHILSARYRCQELGEERLEKRLRNGQPK